MLRALGMIPLSTQACSLAKGMYHSSLSLSVAIVGAGLAGNHTGAQSLCSTFRIKSLHTSSQKPRSSVSAWSPAKAASGPNLKLDQKWEDSRRKNQARRVKPDWMVQKEALKKKFPNGWNPPKKISRPSMALLRTLHRKDSQQFSLEVLADKFKISPEAVRRILRSKWESAPVASEAEELDDWDTCNESDNHQIPSNLAACLQSSQLPGTGSSKLQETDPGRYDQGRRDMTSTSISTGRLHSKKPRSISHGSSNRGTTPISYNKFSSALGSALCSTPSRNN